MSDEQHDAPKPEGEKSEQYENSVLLIPSPEGDEGGQSQEPWYKRHAFDLLLACVGITLGSILIPVFVVPWLSAGSSSTRSTGIGTVVSKSQGTFVSTPPEPKSAVEEIARRNIWSSPPVTYSEANEAAKRMPYSGEEVILPTEQEGETINQRPEAVLPAELAEERREGNSSKPILVVGKVSNVQTVASRFLGQSFTETEAEGKSEKPVDQLEQTGTRSTNAYVECSPVVAKVSTGEIVIALGRLAAVGETHGNQVTSAYLLAELAEPIHEASELDSVHLRELYRLAKSGATKKREGGSLPFIP